VKRDLRRRSANHVLLKWGVIGVFLTSAYAVLAAPPTSKRQEALFHLLKHDCGSCHGMTLRGGLGPPLTAAALERRSSPALEATILFGRPGTPMPPWKGMLSGAEVEWVVRRLKSGDAP